jgi:hypothetical protein
MSENGSTGGFLKVVLFKISTMVEVRSKEILSVSPFTTGKVVQF